MDDPYKRIFGISGDKDADLSGVRSNDLLSEAIILHLAEMAVQYGFLILRPYYGGKKPNIKIEIPTSEQRNCIEFSR